jgi:hypothetical protein
MRNIEIIDQCFDKRLQSVCYEDLASFQVFQYYIILNIVKEKPNCCKNGSFQVSFFLRLKIINHDNNLSRYTTIFFFFQGVSNALANILNLIYWLFLKRFHLTVVMNEIEKYVNSMEMNRVNIKLLIRDHNWIEP